MYIENYHEVIKSHINIDTVYLNIYIYTYILNTHSIADLTIDIEHLDILRIQSQLHPISLPWPVASWLHTTKPVGWHQQPVPRQLVHVTMFPDPFL